jgi:hypothetical protein
MTEETTRAGFVEDVGSVFSAYVESDDGRECIGGDLAERGAEEMARQFAEAEHFFRGFVMAAEQLDYGIYLSACEALDTARKARKAAESYAEEAS